MKPIRLSLQAFGPFPTTEVVDFRSAIETGLFGIYGQTGAGKSTLFNLITGNIAADSGRIPVSHHDFLLTTDGGDFTLELNASGFGRAS